MRWRSPAEIAFRLRQEALNLSLLTRPPRLPKGMEPRAPFPDAAAAVETFRSTEIADRILLHRFPLLGMEIDTGPEIQWRRDYIHNKETGTDYFRRIPYLDASVAGDHKIIWELNRHQHLLLLAQAYRHTGRREYLEEIGNQLESWFLANPVQRGINWASALEVAFRALSWMWVDHLAGASLGEERRGRLREGLYRHAFHLEANLSVYFSPNTHLLGEAVALHALGMMFRGAPPAERWERNGARIVGEEMERQVRTDGTHFEQSSYYHVYALDMFLFHAILVPPSEAYRRKLEKMAVYLEALMGPSHSLPFIGDDDGGRFFHPYGARDRFGAATLAACGQFLGRADWIGAEEELNELAVWWMGPRVGEGAATKIAAGESIRFADAGVVVMRSGSAQVVVDAGPFGPFRGGHSHADTLSIVARAEGRELLIDPGTFSYTGDSRDQFRGTAAHNTVRIGGMDQAEPAGPFGWRNPPGVEVRAWSSDATADYLDAACRYRGFVHRRRVYFLKPDVLFILDDIEGGKIAAEQFWHAGGAVKSCGSGCFRIGGAGTLIVNGDAPEAAESGWRSRAYGAKEAAPVIVSRRAGEGAIQFGAVLTFTADSAGELVVAGSRNGTKMMLSGPQKLAITFPNEGMPVPL